jgi:pimeloyl-ACP methyl ester carboxylesterase
MPLTPRRIWLVLAASALLAACANAPAPAPAPKAYPPIVFVHGNGDTAALWTTTLWRFESQGWPRDRLVAVDLPNPLSRDDDTVAQPGRSSAAEAAMALAAEVDSTLQRTGARQVVLVGNSRGGNEIRNFIQNYGGAAKVERVVLGGTPSHGVWADAKVRPNNEFNGAGPFLTGLNAPKGPNGDEVTLGVAWMTLRSDNNDKYAQPDGVWIGQRGTPTHVTFEGPALKGALNIVLPGRDHRETSYHPESFAKTFEFITGRPPAGTAIVPEERPVLDGKINAATNLPIAGAAIEVYAVDPATGARRGPAVHTQTVGADGRWGPFAAANDQPYEFVVTAPGYATTHVYRGPFPRSSDIVHIRPERWADADKNTQALVILSRPRGYFGVPRDHIVFDGITPPPGVPAGVAGVATSKLKLNSAEGRPVAAEFDSGVIHQRLVGRTWPAAENHIVVLELTD